MGCDLSMNESIKEKLRKHHVFDWLSDDFFNTAQWSDWEDMLCDIRDDLIAKEGDLIQAISTNEELGYIKKNISEGYWNKLGLKLVEEKIVPVPYKVVQLTKKKREALGRLATVFESDRGCGSEENSYLWNCCNDCQPIIGMDCDALSRLQRAAAFRLVLAAQKPILEYEVPQLGEEDREALRVWVKRDTSYSCSRVNCDSCCWKIFDRSKFDPNHNNCIAVWCRSNGLEDQFIAALKDVHSQQKPLPKKPFVRYAAVRTNLRGMGCSDRGSVLLIKNEIEEDGISARQIDAMGIKHASPNLIPITNQSDACKILMELEGKQDIIEAIKEWLKKNMDALGRTQYDTGYWYACDMLLHYINDLESKEGKENSS